MRSSPSPPAPEQPPLLGGQAGFEMSDAVEAACGLVKKLNMPAQFHSVYIRTETTAGGDFSKTLCVSWNPGLKAPPELPNEFMGYPVVNTPWPKGL